ncbi:hypothetical protein QJS66_18685 [Kocuria rhizophila]|nr:hypothetical protein QJS66_18685 [Kocuria rhizophila]
MVTVEVAPGLGISSGKLTAQCGRAAARVGADAPDVRDRWQASSSPRAGGVPSEREWAGTRRPVTVADSGLAELDGPTDTTRAWWWGALVAV